MYEFETFVYLDVQKTGSSFISGLLRRFCLEKEICHRKHKCVETYASGKFHFISVRDPLDQYLSLYSFGCGGAGGLYRALKRRGLEEFYDSSRSGFRHWLKFALDPSNAASLDADYGNLGSIPELIGFQSYRYLELALPNPAMALAECRTRDDLRQIYKARNIVDFTVRNESLKADMESLLKTKLEGSISLDGALEYLEESPRRNTSDRVDKLDTRPFLNSVQKERLKDREWLLYELFGY